MDGLIACAVNGIPGGVYNLASGKETKIKELAEKIIEYTKSNSELKLLPRRDWDNSGRRYGNTKKSEEEIGFKCRISFDEGIKKTVDWTIQNRELIQSCINKHNFYNF